MDQEKREKLIEFLVDRNPYPTDVFSEPPPADWKRMAKVLTDAGISPDRVFAQWGRMGRENCINDVRLMFEVWEEEE